MKGRKPKAPGTRQRRNKEPAGVELGPESEFARAKVPPMPKCPHASGWHDEAKTAWEEMFRSPNAAKFLKIDMARQRILIERIDAYWRNPSDSTWAQIRLEGDNFGASPMARGRLKWEIRDREPATEAVAVGDGRPAPTKRGDTMNVLRGDFKK